MRIAGPIARSSHGPHVDSVPPYFLDVSVAEEESQIMTNAQDDHFQFEMSPFEQCWPAPSHPPQRIRPSNRLRNTSPWSHGQVDRHVHRLKLLKGQMFGRAKFDPSETALPLCRGAAIAATSPIKRNSSFTKSTEEPLYRDSDTTLSSQRPSRKG